MPELENSANSANNYCDSKFDIQDRHYKVNWKISKINEVIAVSKTLKTYLKNIKEICDESRSKLN